MEDITKRFAFDPQGHYYYKAKDRKDSKGNLIRKGFWTRLSKVNAYCLINLQKTVEDAGNKNTKLWYVLEDEIQTRRTRGELPPERQG